MNDYYFSGSLAENTYNLFRVLWSNSGKWPVVTPSAFLNSVWLSLPEFRGYLQHDAQEFLWFFFFKKRYLFLCINK